MNYQCRIARNGINSVSLLTLFTVDSSYTAFKNLKFSSSVVGAIGANQFPVIAGTGWPSNYTETISSGCPTAEIGEGPGTSTLEYLYFQGAMQIGIFRHGSNVLQHYEDCTYVDTITTGLPANRAAFATTGTDLYAYFANTTGSVSSCHFLEDYSPAPLWDAPVPISSTTGLTPLAATFAGTVQSLLLGKVNGSSKIYYLNNSATQIYSTTDAVSIIGGLSPGGGFAAVGFPLVQEMRILDKP